MNSMIKKYMPYAITIFAVFLILPLLFINKTMSNFFAIAEYIAFPAVTIVCSALYCSKHGLDFLFALIAPIAFLFTMLIYCGGFSLTNVILLGVYLVSGIFGLFIGDIALGDKRRQKEKAEKKEAEELMLEAKRRDEKEKEKMAQKKSSPTYDDDDFDYDKYLSDIDKSISDSTEDEIDQILNEFR